MLSEMSAVVKRVCVLSHAEYGGLGLDFSYNIAVSEELGHIRCGGIPMAIGVQTDMATPALARYNPTGLMVHDGAWVMKQFDSFADICLRRKKFRFTYPPNPAFSLFS